MADINQPDKYSCVPSANTHKIHTHESKATLSPCYEDIYLYIYTQKKNLCTLDTNEKCELPPSLSPFSIATTAAKRVGNI